MKTVAKCLFGLLFLSACTEDINIQVPVPDFRSGDLISETYPISDDTKARMNGIYKVIDGSSSFGETVVLKWCGKFLSVFAGKNFAFMQLKAGEIDSIIFLEGYWRFANDKDIGLVRLTIKRDEGGRDLMTTGKAPDSLIMRGGFGSDFSIPGNLLTLKYVKPLGINKGDFMILAHRGGGRNSDRLPASENSVQMIRLAEELGATGVEIDVRLTRDSVPILFHDENLSPRTVTGDFLIGPISNYTFKQLFLFCTLKNGEKVPTLTEALNAVVYDTHLRVIWLDTKVPGLMNTIIALQREYIDKAKAAGRNLEIFIGIPDEGIRNEYLSHPDHSSAPSLCEISIEEAEKCRSKVWAPRWTLGTVNYDVARVHNSSMKAYVWTLDDQEFVKSFVGEGAFDGILTNYPYLVAYEYYTKISK